MRERVNILDGEVTYPGWEGVPTFARVATPGCGQTENITSRLAIRTRSVINI